MELVGMPQNIEHLDDRPDLTTERKKIRRDLVLNWKPALVPAPGPHPSLIKYIEVAPGIKTLQK